MQKEIYEAVTTKIIESLEHGVIPWRKPWITAVPQNVNGRPYTGINRLLLELTEYKYPFFLTFNQAKQLNGYIKKGEQSHIVVFWKMTNTSSTNDDGEETIRKYFMLRYYRVFNIDQTDLPVSVAKNADKMGIDIEAGHGEPIKNAEELVESFNNVPPIEFGWNEACYIPRQDKILLPYQHLFRSEEEFYSTEFHEIIHSTGHPKRLNRKGIQLVNFGSDAYSLEELIAEIGAAFLCSDCGIQNTLPNTTAYIQSWIQVLKNDPKMVLHAAGQAQKAIDFLTGIKH